MSDIEKPHCPVCAGEMSLKQVFRQMSFEHHVFKCTSCDLEYPVVKQGD